MVCSRCGKHAVENQRFCVGCGQALTDSCPKCGLNTQAGDRFCGACGTALAGAPEHSPRRYTPKHLAERILRQRAAIEGERKEVTVLFTDIKGSMDLAASVDPEEWHAILDRFFSVLTEGVHRFEGSINQYTGDGIMALFGAPIALEDHARRACFAALSLRDSVRELGRELRRERGLDFAARIGLNSGAVIVGAIGDDLRMDYTAQGQVVGMAARMEQLAEAGAVYVSPDTAKLVERYFELDDLGLHHVKGMGERVRVFELVASAGTVTRLDVSRARGLSRFVGRAAELAELETVAGKGAARGRVAVVAQAGQGKSRLCLEFVERCRVRGATILTCAGLSHATAIPYLPILQLFRQVLGVGEGERGRQVRDRVAGRVLLLGEQYRDHVGLVCELLGLEDGDAEVSAQVEDRRRSALDVLVALIADVCRGGDVVLWLEDLHWFDAASESLVRDLLAAVESPHLKTLATFRPDYSGDWITSAGFRVVRLEPLDAREMEHLIEALVGNPATVADLGSAIAQNAAGNPFFAEEIVRELAETGGLVGDPGSYVRGAGEVDLEIPATVQAVLAARIDRLDEESKAVLQASAVVGREFTRAVIAPVCDLDPDRLGNALADLVGRGFVYVVSRDPSEAYAFEHPLTQEVAASTLLSSRRRALHCAVAGSLESEDPARADERAALIAEHWELGGAATEAAQWHRRAALWSSLGDVRETIRHWGKVRELIDPEIDDSALLALRLRACREILSMATRVGMRTSDLGRVREEAHASARKLGDDAARAAIESSYALSRSLEGDIDGALESLAIARPLAQRQVGVEAVADFALTAGHVYSWGGRCLDQIEVCDFGLRRVEGTSDPYTIGVAAWLQIVRGDGLAHNGKLQLGADEIERAMKTLTVGRSAEISGFAHAYLARIHTFAGRYEAALRSADQAIELSEHSGSVGVWGTATAYRAAILVARHDWAEAIEVLAEVVDILGRGGIALFRAFALSQLALAHAGAGTVQNAREVSRRAIESSRQCGAAGYGVLALFAACQTALLQGDAAGAAAQLQDATQEIERLGLLVHRPDLEIEQARLALSVGDEAAASEQLERAVVGLRGIGAVDRAASVESDGLDPLRCPL